MFEFYGYFRSSAAYRCRIAFNLKNIDYKFIPIHLRKDGGQQFSPEYKKINPQSLVPSLKENDFSLTQSLAIIEWLEEKYPGPNLLPEDINMRAKARAFCLTIACEIHPFQNLRVQEFIREEFNQNDEKIEKWLTRWMAGGLTECEEILSNLNSQYKFCFFPKLEKCKGLITREQLFFHLAFHLMLFLYQHESTDHHLKAVQRH